MTQVSWFDRWWKRHVCDIGPLDESDLLVERSHGTRSVNVGDRVRVEPLTPDGFQHPQAGTVAWVMKITPEFDDAPDFLRKVEQLAKGVIRRHEPKVICLLKVETFFGSKWLVDIRIPPNRVVSARRIAAPSYEEIALRRKVLRRKAAATTPRAVLVWYSGDSKATGRGAVMAYISGGDAYWSWYAALETGETWRVTEALDIKHEDLASLMELGSGDIQT